MEGKKLQIDIALHIHILELKPHCYKNPNLSWTSQITYKQKNYLQSIQTWALKKNEMSKMQIRYQQILAES